MSRIRIELDGPWDFFPDPRQELSPTSLDDLEPREIQVPGPWQAQFRDLEEYTGVAWYRRRFALSAQSAMHPTGDSTFVLHFGAVDYYTSVWLNGKQVGEHEGGYLPFEIALDEAIDLKGENELVVRVVDPGDDTELYPEFAFAEVPHGKQSWYGPVGGIWQSVWIEARHATYITRLHVTPDVQGEQAQVEILLNRPVEREMPLLLTVTDPHGHAREHNYMLFPNETLFEATLLIPEPLLWDTHSPDLYYLEAKLMGDDGKETDCYGSNFGMREITVSPDGHLVLNGRVLYLRGALDQDYYPNLIYTPFGDAELDAQFQKARHMGLNCLRTHIKITDPRYYDAADRNGVLIWTELPNWTTLTSKVKQRARQTLTGMVARDWNHPSIIIWTIVNEGWGVDLAVSADHRAWLAETYDYLKQLDPHRLVVGNSACFTNFHVVTDIADFHNYYAIPDHYLKWRDWVQAFAERPSWVFARPYEGIESWRAYLRDPWNPNLRQLAPEVRRKGTEPIVVSEFGNWGLPDVEKLYECYGGKEPYWFESGEEWGDGAVYPHGAEHRFRMWHIDKVFPTFSDLARASQKMEFVALKYEIEQIRRYPSIVGYIITEFTDVNWESNGLLDMCRNPKVFYDDLRDVNRADAILPDWDRIAFWEGDHVRIDLMLAHFSDADLRHSRLDWRVQGLEGVGGAFEELDASRAQLTRVGRVKFEIPALDCSRRAVLELELRNAIGEVMTRNQQELYLFPRGAGAPIATPVYAPPGLAEKLAALGYRVTGEMGGSDIAVVDTLTDELRWYLQNGGRVLWLAESKESQQTYLKNFDIANRTGILAGDWASNFNWIREDRLFTNLPTDNLVDFAFKDLTPEAVIKGLGPRDFANYVYAGMFVGWIHDTVALIAEQPFGNGNLLACTFRLTEQMTRHPVAAIMLHDMLEHLEKRATIPHPQAYDAQLTSGLGPRP